MARKYLDEENTAFERVVKEHFGIDGKIDWKEVLKEVSEESGKKPTLGALKMRYRRLMAQDGVRQSSRAGDKTLKRTVKWIENLLESNQRMRAQLNAKKGKRNSSARTELLEKKNKEFREEIRSLKKELKSHGPILKWYIDAQKGFKIAKEKKALIE